MVPVALCILVICVCVHSYFYPFALLFHKISDMCKYASNSCHLWFEAIIWHFCGVYADREKSCKLRDLKFKFPMPRKSWRQA